MRLPAEIVLAMLTMAEAVAVPAQVKGAPLADILELPDSRLIAGLVVFWATETRVRFALHDTS